MLGRSFGTRDRVGKLTKPQKRSFRDHVKQKMMESLDGQMPDERYGDRPLISKPVMVATHYPVPPSYPKDIQPPGKTILMGVGSKTNRDVQSKFNELGLTEPPSASPALTSAIITIVVGQEQRLFAAHEDVLAHSPFFASACRDRFFDQGNDRRVFLPDEEPETFSCVLEYLYKGDYSPRLMHDKRRNTWTLEADVRESPRISGGRAAPPANNTANPAATLFHPGAGDVILRDTAVYCAADRYGLDELKRLALRKQGLQSGIEVATILRSARFAYDHTPDTDSRLRAHYLALIIRSRKTFKRSGTMQMEMEAGGKLFFDLFVAMCNHMDDLEGLNQKGTPRTI